jgi:flagellar hook-associated protein 1 FlgK
VPTSFGRIETLLRGLQAQQRAVDTTTHNIANAGTEGYARQRTQFVTTPAYTVSTFNRNLSAGQVGTGVAVASISRMRDGFLDMQYRLQNQRFGEASARAGVYKQVEAVYNEPTEAGLSAFIDRFWQSWQSLVNRPDDPATRAFVIEEARNLSANVNRVRQQLDAQSQNTAESVSYKIDEVNAVASEIAALNVQITSVQAAGQQPNDLLDSRDMLLDRLSKLVGTNNVYGPDGAVNIYIGGRALVSRDQVNALATDDTGGTLQIVWQSDGSQASVQGGSVSGLVNMVNVDIPDALNDLIALRDEIVTQVNTTHQAGYGLNDPAGPPPARDFFEVLPNGDMHVRDEIANDPSKIAASTLAGAPGNGENALAILNLRYNRSMSSNSATINDFYNAMVARVGGRTREASTTETNQNVLLETVDRQRREVSEVSLDEEAANLIKFQQSYAAAARAMTVVDEMLNQIINNMGLVGR